jgi:hypothetical protein
MEVQRIRDDVFSLYLKLLEQHVVPEEGFAICITIKKEMWLDFAASVLMQFGFPRDHKGETRMYWQGIEFRCEGD